jgi:hypothetical protein
MSRKNVIILVALGVVLAIAAYLWYGTPKGYSAEQIALIRSQLTSAAAMYVSDSEGGLPKEVEDLKPYLQNAKLMQDAHNLQQAGYAITFRRDTGSADIPGLAKTLQEPQQAPKVGVVVEITGPEK